MLSPTTHTAAVRYLEAAHERSLATCENLLAIAEHCAATGDIAGLADALTRSRLPLATLRGTTNWKAGVPHA